MSDKLAQHLKTELAVFEAFDCSTSIQSITEAYHRLLAIVQALMLQNDNPAGHDRAWTLLKDDAFKSLDQLQERNAEALDDLKRTITQVGHLLLNH